MRDVRTRPLLHGLPVLILDDQVSTRQLFLIRDILLGNLDFDELVLHFHLLYLTGIRDGKVDTLRF